MKRFLLLVSILLVGIGPLWGQAVGAVQNHSFLGGKKAVTSGINSTNYLDGIVPHATITVYLAGTTTKATLYSNSLLTPLGNPFTSNDATSVDPGGFVFWAAVNQGLDVVMTGGIAPNTYPAPVTLVDVFPSQSFTPVAGLTNLNAQIGPSITLQSSGATINVTNPSPNVINIDTAGGAGGVSQLIAGSGISLSPAGGTGNVTVTNTGSFNPPNTNYVWMGDSRLMIATFNQVTATAASMNGTTVTITLPNVAGNWVDNTALVPGDSVQFFNNASNWSPSCLGWGNGTVLTASATQITVAQNNLGPVSCVGTLSGTGGVVQKANYLVPQLTAREPYFNGHGTTYNMAVPGEATNTIGTTYTNYVHALSPAVTGNPGYLILQVGSQNGLGCTAVATIESQLQTFWATAHADGWTIVETSLITAGPTISCPSDAIIDQVNYWLRSQVKGYDQTLTTANKYWDIFVDVANYVGDINDPNIFATGSENLHFNNGGTKVVSSLMNLAMVAKGSIPRDSKAGYMTGQFLVDTTATANLGTGPGVFDQAAWSSNTTPGKFYMTIDKTTPARYVNAFVDPAGNLDVTGFRVLPWNGDTAGFGWIMRYNGGYCWLAQGGTYMSQSLTDTCLKKQATGEVALGNATTQADFSGQLDLTQLKMAATHPTGVCTVNGSWQLTQDGSAYYCAAGTWTAFGGGGGSSAFNAITSGTNTTAAMVVGSGGSMDYSGTGTIDANKLLTNTVPANSQGYFYNNGTGTLSWTLGPGATVKTTNYTALVTDGGLFVMNCASACALTLPASSIPTGFNLAVQAVNTGAVTIAPNGNTIYLANSTGGTGSVTVPQGQTLYVAWDGTAFRATAPWLAGTNVTITPSSTGITVAATAGGGGVSSFSGDGTLINNSASTGAVTATLANAAAHKFWGNNTGSSAAPGYLTIGSQDESPSEYIAGGGTGNAQTATLSPAVTSLATGLRVEWKPTAANTGAATLAVNGLTATSITKCGTTTLAASDLTTTAVAIAIYDGTQFQLINPQATPCGSGGGGSYPTPVTLTASASTELDFTTCLSSSYNDYQIRFNTIVLSGAVDLFIQVSTNGGSTYDTNSGNYKTGSYNFDMSSGAPNATTPAATTGVSLTSGGAVSTTGGQLTGSIMMLNVNSASTSVSHPFFGTTQYRENSTADQMMKNIDALWTTTSTAYNAFRIIPTSGTITSGSVTCQPLPK